MRIAVSHWQNRISPVFDVANKLLLIDLNDNVESDRLDITLEENSVCDRTQRISQYDVNILICGAISRPLELALCNAGVEVLAQTCGEVEQVIDAYRSGNLQHAAFRMPGTHRRKHRFCENRCCGRWNRSRK